MAFSALLISLFLGAVYLAKPAAPARHELAVPARSPVDPAGGRESAPSERAPAANGVGGGGTESPGTEPSPGPCALLRGVVNSLVGVPLPSVGLRVSTSSGAEPQRIRSDSGGRFEAAVVATNEGDATQIFVDGDDPHYGATTYTTTVACGSDPVILEITLVATPERCWVSGTLRWQDGQAVERGFVGPNQRSFVDADDRGRFSLLMDVWGGSIALAYGAHERGAFCAGYTRIQVTPAQMALGRVVDLVLTLERPTQTRILEVVDPGGQPLEGVRVLWNGRPPEKSTDHQGRLEIRFGETANATVALECAGFGRGFVGMRTGEDGDVVRATLFPTRLLPGIVLNESGAPSAGARVWSSVTGTFMAQDRVSTVADESGRFRFEATEDGRPLYLTARAKDGGIGHVVHQGSFPDVPFTITAVKGEPLHGVVVGPGGAPLRAARVIAHRQDRREFDPPLFDTGEDGRFTLHLRPEGAYRIQASRDGYRRVEQPLESMDFVQISMTPTGGLTGQVLGPDGTPMRSFRIRVFSLDEEDPVTLIPWTYFTGDGRFSVQIAGADIDAACRLQVESDDLQLQELTARVMPAGTDPLTVRF